MSKPIPIDVTSGSGKALGGNAPAQRLAAGGGDLSDQRPLLPDPPLVYVATPLAAGKAPTRAELEAAVADARRTAQILRSSGHRVFCPVEAFVRSRCHRVSIRSTPACGGELPNRSGIAPTSWRW